MTRKHTLLITLFSISAVIALSLPTALHAQDDPPPQTVRPPMYLGISAGIFYSMHSGGFGYPAECEDCAVYGDASGIGTAFDLRLSVPLTPWLRFEPRLFGEGRSGDFTSDLIESEIIGKDMKPQQIQLEDEFSSSLQLVGIDLLAAFHIGRSGIAVLAGPAIAFRMSESATVTERILSPDGVTFLDGSREQTRFDGDTEIARGMHAGIRAGLSYTLPVSRALALGFEATYLLSLQTVSETDDWKTSGARGMLSVLYAL
ncbi:MAG: hypothetical protein WBQ23_05335 [Bacteroidota bacterium]